ncbi:hypothetical protein K1T71_009041 [Dendrolimus kikuchii]|uniref:Uncharacterized protein n=1 Tax=Dendrolimus kikuchii TaxID=765133 RepID=A0ACC1CXN8_9NEOP|nr:hypothetical protein K1T71_009041 [Dendrolimus kikuchii]
MEINFKDKVVLVTGASAGIGEAIAILFAKYGATLALVGRNEENLNRVAEKCESEKGVRALRIVADLGTDEGCERTANDTLKRFGRLDVLINNAGIVARTSILYTDMKTFDDIFNTDVRGVYNLTRLLVPALIESKGNIVNISSISGTAVAVGSLPYSMAKAALDHFTRLIALELGPMGVRVNTVSPGVTVSKLVQRQVNFTDEEYQAWLQESSKKIPMGEVCLGEDIAKMVVHVASDNCRLFYKINCLSYIIAWILRQIIDKNTMEFNFKNKVVLVTGASAGIGESTALLFAKHGAKLALVGRNEKNLQEVADKCEKEKGVKALAIVADLGTDDGCEKTARETLNHFGRLDVLVNNAAVGARTNIMLANMETFDKVFNVNIRGVYNLTRLLVPALIESKGNIVNVSSIMATMVTTGNLPYSLSKAALDHFSRLLAYELAPKGVRVNVVSPGITVSTFVQRLTGYTDDEYQAWLKTAEATIPMKKACTGEDCANMIVFLASDKCPLVSGTTVPVDGALQFAGSGNSEILKEQVK